MTQILKAVDLDNKKIVYDGCMITKCGIVVDLMNPTPDMIMIEDIAHGLANNCRWNGHTQKFWSVAQHCCMMYDKAPEGFELTYLFHDAEEAYWGDMIKPLKNIIGEKHPEILQRMRDLRKLIYDKFNIPYAGVFTKEEDWNCLQWEFENIVKNNNAVFWSQARAKKEWLKRYYEY
jgi:5'-deoxynucleotidase YfbR-like HD superfamily hydrolase